MPDDLSRVAGLFGGNAFVPAGAGAPHAGRPKDGPSPPSVVRRRPKPVVPSIAEALDPRVVEPVEASVGRRGKVRRPADVTDVAKTQQALVRAGFLEPTQVRSSDGRQVSSVDGVWGKDTERAWRLYKESRAHADPDVRAQAAGVTRAPGPPPGMVAVPDAGAFWSALKEGPSLPPRSPAQPVYATVPGSGQGEDLRPRSALDDMTYGDGLTEAQQVAQAAPDPGLSRMQALGTARGNVLRGLGAPLSLTAYAANQGMWEQTYMSVAQEESKRLGRPLTRYEKAQVAREVLSHMENVGSVGPAAAAAGSAALGMRGAKVLQGLAQAADAVQYVQPVADLAMSKGGARGGADPAGAASTLAVMLGLGGAGKAFGAIDAANARKAADAQARLSVPRSPRPAPTVDAIQGRPTAESPSVVPETQVPSVEPAPTAAKKAHAPRPVKLNESLEEPKAVTEVELPGLPARRSEGLPGGLGGADEALAPRPAKARAEQAKAVVEKAPTDVRDVAEAARGERRWVNPDVLKVNPAIQYKGGLSDLVNRVSSAFKGLDMYHVGQGGELSVWERLDGTLEIAHGHHRAELAKRAKKFVDNWKGGADREVPRELPVRVYKESDGWAINDIRRNAAIENLRNGDGSALDAAMVLRETGVSPEDMTSQYGVRMSARLSKEVDGLLRLPEDAMRFVRKGEVHEAAAAGVGSVDGMDGPTQMAAVKRAGETGQKTYEEGQVFGRVFRDAIVKRDADDGGFGDLFGGEFAPVVDSLTEQVALDKGAKSGIIASWDDAKSGLKLDLWEGEAINDVARHAALESYGKRGELAAKIDLVLDKVPELKDLRRELAEKVKTGDETLAKATRQYTDAVLEWTRKPVKDIIAARDRKGVPGERLQGVPEGQPGRGAHGADAAVPSDVAGTADAKAASPKTKVQEWKESNDARLGELEASRKSRIQNAKDKRRGAVDIGPDDFEYVARKALALALEGAEHVEAAVRRLAKEERFTPQETARSLKTARDISKKEGSGHVFEEPEPDLAQEGVTGMARQVSDPLRKGLGREPAPRQGVTVAGLASEAEKSVRSGKVDPRDVLQSVLEGKRKPDAQTASVIEVHLRDTVSKVRDARGKAASGDLDAQAAYDAGLTELDRIEAAAQAHRHEFHSLGMALQVARHEDMSLAGLRAKAYSANGWEPLSKHDADEVARIAKEHEDALKVKDAEIARLDELLKSQAKGPSTGVRKAKARATRDAAFANIKDILEKRASAGVMFSDPFGAGATANALATVEAVAPHVRAALRAMADEGVATLAEAIEKLKSTVPGVTEGLVRRVLTGDFPRSPSSKKDATVFGEWVKEAMGARRESAFARRFESARASGDMRKASKEVNTVVHEGVRAGRVHGWDDAVREVKRRVPTASEDDVLGAMSGQYRQSLDHKGLLSRQSRRHVAQLKRAAAFRVMTSLQKAGVIAKEGLTSGQRAVQATGDVSAAGVQGAKVALFHPKAWVKAWLPSLEALGTKGGTDRVAARLARRESYDEAMGAGLSLTDMDAGFTHAEEFGLSALLDRALPGGGRGAALRDRMGRFDGAYQSFLNHARMDMFEEMMRHAPVTGKAREAWARDAAQYVNVISGRGHGEPARSASGTLPSLVLFSPRMLVSDLQTAAFVPMLNTETGRGGFALHAAKKYAQAVATMASAVWIAKLMGWRVEEDPRSTDFMRLTAPDGTQFAPFDRFVWPVKAYFQMTAGSISRKGDFTAPDKWGSKGGWDVLESKASPLARTIDTLRTGMRYDQDEGKPVPYSSVAKGGLGEVARDLLMPISWKETGRVLDKDAPLLHRAVAVPAALTGLTVQKARPEAAGKRRPKLDARFELFERLAGRGGAKDEKPSKRARKKRRTR